MKRIIGLTLLTSALLAGSASATIIETTSAWDNASYISSFGGTTTYGQTFRLNAGDDRSLDSVTVYFNTRTTDLSYRFYLYEWGTDNVQGGALYTSGVQSITSNSMAAATVNVGGVTLDTLVDYVFFVSEWGVTSPGYALMGGTYSGNTYANGRFVYDNGDYSSGSWVTTYGGGNAELAFDLRLSSTAVPEPSSLALLGLGVLGLAYSRRRGRALRSR